MDIWTALEEGPLQMVFMTEEVHGGGSGLHQHAHQCNSFVTFLVPKFNLTPYSDSVFTGASDLPKLCQVGYCLPNTGERIPAIKKNLSYSLLP